MYISIHVTVILHDTKAQDNGKFLLNCACESLTLNRHEITRVNCIRKLRNFIQQNSFKNEIFTLEIILLKRQSTTPLLSWSNRPFHWRFTIKIKIPWKNCIGVVRLLGIRSLQYLAHDVTAQLSHHVQNFVAITLLDKTKMKPVKLNWMGNIFSEMDPRKGWVP